MCVRARREFYSIDTDGGDESGVAREPAPAGGPAASAVGAFAAAAVLAALDPDDWQIAQDVDHAAGRIIERWRSAGRPEQPFAVTVDVHASHVELHVADGLAPDAPDEQVVLTPRRPFRTALACALASAQTGALAGAPAETEQPRHAAHPTPRPWFANGRPNTPVAGGGRVDADLPAARPADRAVR